MDSKSQPNHPSSLDRRPLPPQLPPRQPTPTSAPPPYESILDPPEAMLDRSWAAQDPRRLSTDSLTPHASNKQGGRRKLLLIYIHGFMGNETSFRSFPAHVHNLLTVLLAETHVVHSKLYPRYRSKRNIRFARDDFSSWLEPHEAVDTDVVLLGHSMGGLVSAEVAVMPPAPPASRPLKHRLLGTVNFDVPFLGMHPGVVKSGLASLFGAPPEAPADKWSGTALQRLDSGEGEGGSSVSPPARADTFWQPSDPDPNYNPAFPNDNLLPMRKGWANALHFVSKHSDSLGKATKQLVTSHMEFGGAMANYAELKGRYAKVRALEEDIEGVRKGVLGLDKNVAPPRVRFVNYYTACHGRPKREKELPEGVGKDAELEVQPREGLPVARSPSPRISVEEFRDGRLESRHLDLPSNGDDYSHVPLGEMQNIDPFTESRSPSPGPAPLSPAEIAPTLDSRTNSLSLTSSLPPIPDPPTAPPPLDTSFISDKDTKKLVEKEHARSVKVYEKAVKERERVIKEREKFERRKGEKERKGSEKAGKDAEKAEKDAEKARRKKEKERQKETEGNRELTHSEREMKRLAEEKDRMEREGRRMRGEPESEPESRDASGSDDDDAGSVPALSSTRAPSLVAISRSTTRDTTGSTKAKGIEEANSKATENTKSKSTATKKPSGPPKDRKFCSLPPKDSTGQRDPCWVRIFMKDVDEVGAHCGLFFVDERYERLVGETAGRVEGWVREAGL